MEEIICYALAYTYDQLYYGSTTRFRGIYNDLELAKRDAEALAKEINAKRIDDTIWKFTSNADDLWITIEVVEVVMNKLVDMI